MEGSKQHFSHVPVVRVLVVESRVDWSKNAFRMNVTFSRGEEGVGIEKQGRSGLGSKNEFLFLQAPSDVE